MSWITEKREAALYRQHNLEKIGQETVLNEMIAFELNKIISFLNTLEVIEVDESSYNRLQKAAENHAAERFRTTRDAFLAEKCKWSFIAGAQWRLDSLWHDSSKEQPKELETVIYNGKKWCYLSDILSMTKD